MRPAVTSPSRVRFSRSPEAVWRPSSPSRRPPAARAARHTRAGARAGGTPPSPGAFQPEPGGGVDAFLAKLGPSGEVVYSTYLGGSGHDEGFGVAADPSGAGHGGGGSYGAGVPEG